MKKFLIILSIMFCSVAFAHTIEWYVGDNLLSTTTCESGDNITPPTIPEKFGYHFKEWTGYIPIEYLEGAGTQAIRINVITENQYLHVKIGCSLSKLEHINFSSTRNVTLYYEINEKAFGLWLARDNIGVYQTLISPNINVKYDIDYTITPTNIVFKVNDKTLTTSGYNLSNDTSLTVVYSSNIYPFYGRVYYFQIVDSNGVLLADLIPVLDPDGTPCMFDKVEGKYYYNAGTGDFIAGPVIGK